MSRHLPNCPHLSSRHDGCGMAGVIDLMRENGHGGGYEYSVTVTTETVEQPTRARSRSASNRNARHNAFYEGYRVGYLEGYADAVEDSKKTRYEVTTYIGQHVMSWQEKKDLWKELRKK